jgi:hypothetical protein
VDHQTKQNMKNFKDFILIFMALLFLDNQVGRPLSPFKPNKPNKREGLWGMIIILICAPLGFFLGWLVGHLF